MPLAGQKRKRTTSQSVFLTPQPKHPYLSGNFAPIQQTLPLTPCTYTGTIPEVLANGEYVRNGSNPVSNEDLGRDAHWFDGDGMLSGVSFRKDDDTGDIQPEFVNQFVHTDIYLSTLSSPRLRVPILPSIATLVNPLASVLYVTWRIIRTVFLVLLSHLPGSKQKIKKISAANTNVIYHDGRAMALCESGPPMRIQLPSLETVGWYDGASAEGEPESETTSLEDARVFGEGSGMLKFMREWTTAHPKVDPQTKEMLLFHASFARAYVQYSIIPPTSNAGSIAPEERQEKILNAPIPGVRKAKMMHDFGVSSRHTIIMDLPLTLDPLNQLKGLPPVTYDSEMPSRFGVFPRRRPTDVRWFETDSCCIFHTANTWDSTDSAGETTAVNLLACRLTSATLIYAAGNVAAPALNQHTGVPAAKRHVSFFSKYDYDTESTVWERQSLLESPVEEKETCVRVNAAGNSAVMYDDVFEEDQCRLYYYNFDLRTGNIEHQWALSSIPFEFPSVRPDVEMQEARYIYGCSTTSTDFGSALGKATKIDALVKIDVRTLISQGQQHPPRSMTGVVDSRSMAEVLAGKNLEDPIQVFVMPDGWYAQEPRFVPTSDSETEDDGFLLFYAFDESQLDCNGDSPPDSSTSRARSQLWIINARDMKTVIAQVQLPQRVPYGLHGSWFSAEQINDQRPVESIRTTTQALSAKDEGAWMTIRDWLEKALG